MAVSAGDALQTLHRRSTDLRLLHQQHFRQACTVKFGPIETGESVQTTPPSHILSIEEYLTENLHSSAIDYASALLNSGRSIPNRLISKLLLETILDPHPRSDEFELQLTTDLPFQQQSSTDATCKRPRNSLGDGSSRVDSNIQIDQVASNFVTSVLIPYAWLHGDRALLDVFDKPAGQVCVPQMKHSMLVRTSITAANEKKRIGSPTESGFWPFLLQLIRQAEDNQRYYCLAECLLDRLERDLFLHLAAPTNSFLYQKMADGKEWPDHMGFIIAQLHRPPVDSNINRCLARILSMYSVICGAVGATMEIEEFCLVIKERLLDSLTFPQLQRFIQKCDDDLFCCHLLDEYLRKDMSAFVASSEDSLLFLNHLLSEPLSGISLQVTERFLWSSMQLTLRLFNFLGPAAEQQILESLSDCIRPFIDGWSAQVETYSGSTCSTPHDSDNNDDDDDDGNIADETKQNCLTYLKVLREIIRPETLN